MKNINVGIIGLGRIGKLHADNIIKNIHGMTIHAVSDVVLDTKWLNERNIKNAYNNPDDIINDDSIDAVLICSPSPTHVPLIISAAKSGKHIFCEKPIALEIEKIQNAISAVNDANVKLQVGFNRRYDPAFSKVQSAVANGQIGTPHLIRITSCDPAPPPLDYIAQSGGIFLDMTIHDFDMARFLSNSEITEVYARGANLIDPLFKQYDDIDTAVIQLKFANGALGVIDNSRKASYGYDQRVEVFGSKGNLSAQNNTPTKVTISTEHGITSDKPHHFFLERYKDAYIKELEAFYDCIVNNNDSLANGNDGLMPVIAGLAAKQSLKTNKPIKLV